MSATETRTPTRRAPPSPFGALRDQVKDRVAADPQPVYEKLGAGELVVKGRNLEGLCPFRPEKTPSFKVGLHGEKHAGRHKCFGCGAGGDAIDFASRKLGLDFVAALKHVAGLVGVEIPEPEIVKVPERVPKGICNKDPSHEIVAQLHAALMRNKKRLKYLVTERLWSRDVIVAGRVGWLGAEKAYTIPLYDDAGDVIDIRLYRPDPPEGLAKVMPWRGGLEIGKRIFGLHLTGPIEPGRTVYIAEGLSDCLALLSHGFPAITNIMGSANWPMDADLRFDGCTVHLVEDNDAAGRKRSHELIPWIFDHGAERVYRLRCVDRGGPDHWDATDTFRSAESDDVIDRAGAFLEREAVAEEQPKRWGLLLDSTPLLTARFPSMTHLIEGMLPASGLAIIGSKPKLGKTTICFNTIARGVVLGTEAFGRKCQKGRVLYLEFEDTTKDLSQMLTSAKWSETETRMLATHSDQPDFDQLEEYLEKGDFRLVVIDTIKRACAGSTLDWADYSQSVKLYGTLDAIGIRQDLCVLANDHHNKMAGRDESEEDPSLDLHGSVAAAGAAQVVLGLYRRRNSPDARLRIQGRGIMGESTIPLLFDRATLTYRLGDVYAEVMALKHAQPIVDSIAAGRGLFSEIVAAADGKKSSASETITKLEDAGVIAARDPAGGSRFWVLTKNYVNRDELTEQPN